MRDVINADHDLAVRTAVMRELGWTGIRGEIVASQLRMFRQILSMPPTRVPHQLMLYHLQHHSNDTGDGETTPPDEHVYPHPTRLTHLGAGEPVDRYSNSVSNYFSTSERKRAPAVLRRGPESPSKSHTVQERLQRLKDVDGLTPGQAVGTKLTSGKAYTLADLKWDIHHKYLVVPALECTTLPPGYDRGTGILQDLRLPRVRRAAEIDAMIHEHYWRIAKASSSPKQQRPIPSTFVASVLI